MKNNRGQIAIFIALIFQVLFVFFAMVINVGLLVHHKINLQNSADLAAYYGAAKQAEMLNAVAHMNYQIRQSWKLLSWRTRIIGTAGYGDHPRSEVEGASRLDDRDEEYASIPAMCVTYKPTWEQMPPNETTCKKMNAGTVNIPNIVPLRVISPIIPNTRRLSDFTFNARDTAIAQCEQYGSANWHFLAQVVFGYKQDQANRKAIIYALANAMSSNPADFVDIDGAQVSVGIRKTLEKNLTFANRTSLHDFKVFNSLATAGCGAIGDNEKPPGWLSEIQTAPGYAYTDTECGGNLRFYAEDFSRAPRYSAENPSLFDQDIFEVTSQEVPGLWRSSLGVEKNPWCMAYVGVSVKTAPQIPFMPISQPIELKATAYAKPFGGKIGPWYNQSWQRGSNRSGGGRKVDPLWPPRSDESGQIADIRDQTRYPNYSRFVGDSVGVNSKMVMAYTGGPFNGTRPHDWDYWINAMTLVNDIQANPAGDLLPWDVFANRTVKARDLEIAVIAPDLFDTTYYSIDPDFYNNYFLRLQAGLNAAGSGERFRADLGWRQDDPDYGSFSIKSQIELVNNSARPTFDFENALRYVLKDFAQLLTSWSENDLSDYSLKPEIFGQCNLPIYDESGQPVHTAGSCVSGGRTGYSVKLVSGDMLRASNLPLGGEGAGEGPLLNPPPSDF